MNNKRAGNRQELRVKHIYENAGWLVVKSGASLSPFDLICINPITLEIHILQIKTGSEIYLRNGVKREEQEYQQYKDGDYKVKFKFIKLRKRHKFTID